MEKFFEKILPSIFTAVFVGVLYGLIGLRDTTNKHIGILAPIDGELFRDAVTEVKRTCKHNVNDGNERDRRLLDLEKEVRTLAQAIVEARGSIERIEVRIEKSRTDYVTQ